MILIILVILIVLITLIVLIILVIVIVVIEVVSREEPRKGTNGVSTNGVTANLYFLSGGLFGFSR